MIIEQITACIIFGYIIEDEEDPVAKHFNCCTIHNLFDRNHSCLFWGIIYRVYATRNSVFITRISRLIDFKKMQCVLLLISQALESTC